MTSQEYYFKPEVPGSLGSSMSLWRALGKKNTLKQTKDILNKENAYTLHKPVRRRFPRRKVVIGGLCQQFEVDLIDVSNLNNKPYRYILTVIDVFSKQLWAQPIQNKSGQSVVKAFDKVLKESRFGVPLYINADKGKEFYNKHFQEYLKKKGIRLFSTENSEIKGSVIERVNRTLKNRLYRYFTKKGSTKFVKVLPLIVEGYNKSVHRSIGMPPLAVNGNNAGAVWTKLYGKKDNKVKPKFKEGDQVRLSKYKKVFKKGYLPNWTEEIFTVLKILNTTPHTYKVKDFSGEEILGSFYDQELQYVKGEIYHIEKIIKSRKRKGRREYFVKWSGYESKHNSWVDESQITNLSK